MRLLVWKNLMSPLFAYTPGCPDAPNINQDSFKELRQRMAQNPELVEPIRYYTPQGRFRTLLVGLGVLAALIGFIIWLVGRIRSRNDY